MATVLDTLVTEIIFKGDTSALENMQKRLSNFTSNLNALGRQLGLAGGAISAFTGLSLKSFANFEDEMAKIVGLVGIPAEQLAQWRQPLLNIARDTAVGPQALAEALFFVTSAGLRGKEAMEVLEQAARAQAAGMGDAKVIADLTTSAINAYGSANLSAVEATDALTEAIRLGKLEPSTMANAIGRVIPLTSAMNVEFNELAGLMAAMSKTGTPVEEAVTSIQAILTTLLNPTKEAEDALADVGLTLADLRNQVANEGILPMLVGLKEAFDGNIESTAAVFGNVRALRGVLDLLGPQMDGNIELLNEMADSAGVLNEAVGAAQESIGFKMRQASVQGQIALQELGRAIEPLANFIFDRLVPGLQLVIGWLQSGNPVVRTLVQSVAVLGGVLVIAASALFAMAATLKLASFTLNGWLGLVKAAHGVVWLWRNALLATRIQMFLLAVQTKLSSIATWLNTTATTANTGTLWGRIAALLASRAAILAGVVATGAATAAQWALNTAMYANPIGLIIAAVIALAAGLFFLVKKVDVVRNAFVVAFNWVKDHWPLLLAIITRPVGLAVYAFVKFKDQIIGVFRQAWEWVKDHWPLLLAIITRPVGLAVYAFVKFKDQIIGVFRQAWEWVKDHWPLLLAIITRPVGLAVYAFVKFKDQIIGVFASVKDFIADFWQRWGGWITGALAVINPFIGIPLLIMRHWDTLKDFFGNLWDNIVGIFMRAWERIKDLPVIGDAIRIVGAGGGLRVRTDDSAAPPAFQQGGVVPGPVGRAQAAIVHGGEMVLPQPFAENLSRLLEGGVSALVGPAPGMATAMAGGGVPGGGYTDNRDMSITISEGAVVVHAAPGQDAAEIGEVVSQKLRAEIRAAYRAFDSGIHR